MLYFGFVGVLGVDLHLKEILPHAADDDGFGYDGPPRVDAGEEDDVGATCTKAWPVVVVVHIYIYIYICVCVYYTLIEPMNPKTLNPKLYKDPIHAYIHLHTYVYDIDTYRHTYTDAHIHTYIPSDLHTYTYLYMPTYLHIYVYIHTFMPADICIYIYTHMHTCTYIYTRTYT